MRIAFFLNKFPLLSETFLLNRIVGLIKRGHEVSIIAFGPSREAITHPLVEQYRLMEILEILRPGSIIPRRKFDILQACFGPVGLKVLALRKMGFFSGKLLTSFHGYDLTSFIQEQGEGVYKDLFLEGDLFLPVSVVFQKRLIELGCKPQKIEVVRTGIDLSHFSRKPVPVNIKIKKILSVGRLVGKKGFEIAIKAFVRVSPGHPGLIYNIAGDGELRPVLEKFIQEAKLENEIRLLGWKDAIQISELMQESDLLIAPSLTSADGNQEGIPNVLKEAMAIGIPVISTFHGGISELVEDGISGILVSENDPETLAHGLSKVLKMDITQRCRMADAGRQQVEIYYDIEKTVDQMIALYESLFTVEP
jgi:colanic acid/amylovoran biosynthesis glycosyltransferase